MRISLLIPCYNAGLYIAAAIASARAQTMPPTEIIVVDDGSTDASATIVAGLDPPVRLFRQPNQGVGSALNLGLIQANGDLIAFLDADDLWTPDKLALQTAILRDNLDLDGVFGHMRMFEDDPADPSHAPHSAPDPDPAQPGMVKGTLLIRRAALDRLGHYDARFRHGDFIAWYARAVEAGFRWQMLPQTVYLRRLHATNLGRIAKVRQREEYLDLMKQFLDRRRAPASGD